MKIFSVTGNLTAESVVTRMKIVTIIPFRRPNPLLNEQLFTLECHFNSLSSFSIFGYTFSNEPKIYLIQKQFNPTSLARFESF